MNFHAIRVSVLACAFALTAALAQSGDDSTSLAAAMAAVRDSRGALQGCNLVRARAQYELAERVLKRTSEQNRLAQTFKAELEALGHDLSKTEKEVEATQSQLTGLIQQKRWTSADALLGATSAQVCPAFYEPFRGIIANGRKPSYSGPGFWSRFGSGIKISAIIGATAAAGVVAIDQVAKH